MSVVAPGQRGARGADGSGAVAAGAGFESALSGDTGGVRGIPVRPLVAVVAGGGFATGWFGRAPEPDGAAEAGPVLSGGGAASTGRVAGCAGPPDVSGGDCRDVVGATVPV